jgi:hypothetical protein
MAGNYTIQNYEQDRKFAVRCGFAENGDSMGKLEVLLDGPGGKEVFMNHEALRSRFLSMKTCYDVLENPVRLAQLILEAHPGENLPHGEFQQWRDECMALIHRRVEAMFGQRYRGALARTIRYERRLVAPVLNELRKALRVRDSEKVYALAERFGIMGENFSENHPSLRAYAALVPQISDVLHPHDPANN